MRNSWGTGWGDAGYFYVSYYDTVFACDEPNVVFDDAEPGGNYSGIYQYDPLGWTSSYGYSSDSAWFANEFTASASDQLAAVSFYAAEPASSYTLYEGDSLSSLTADGSGSLSVAGYHTVSLSSPAQLTSGQLFVVAVQLTTPGYDYPIPLETNIPGYTSDATSAAGESFISYSGSAWTDLTSCSGCGQANVCLKAFTASTVSDLTSPSTIATGLQSSADAAWQNTSQVTLTASDNAGGSGVAATYYVLDGTQHTYTAPFNLTDGAHTVTYWSVDNAGNVETPHTGYANVDTNSPTTTVSGTYADLHKTAVTVTLTASDNAGGSGVAATYYTIDGGGQETYTLPFQVSSQGSHSIAYWSVDNAGNTETAKSCTVKIDTATPTISVSGDDSAWHASAVTLTFTPEAGPSGVTSVEYEIGNGVWTTSVRVHVSTR